MVVVRAGVPGDAGALSALALQSKAYWGYDEMFLEACQSELTLSAGDAAEGVLVAEDDRHLLGFSRVTGWPPVGELNALFVDPPHIGTGVGRLLLRATIIAARHRGLEALEFDADPGAEPFYRSQGAVVVGRSPSGSVAGRVLPRMRLELVQRSDPVSR